MKQLYIHPGKKYRLPRKLKKAFKKYFTQHVKMLWSGQAISELYAEKFAKRLLNPMPKWLIEPPKFEMPPYYTPMKWHPIRREYEFMSFVPPDLEYRGHAFMGLLALP